jgi:hypothetical protein
MLTLIKCHLIPFFVYTQAELRANVFAAIEEEDRGLENEENPSFALLGASNARAKELHSSPTGMIFHFIERCSMLIEP